MSRSALVITAGLVVAAMVAAGWGWRQAASQAQIAAAEATPAAAGSRFVTYTPGALEAALKSGKPLVVHVRADWCPTCRAQDPTLKAMTTEPAYRNVEFMNVNFDDDTDFLKTYGVSLQSTVIVFKGGKEVARFASITDPQKLRQRIDAAI